MAVNRDKPGRWKADIARSVDMYNDWFLRFAPKAFRTTRTRTTGEVERTLQVTTNLRNVSPAVLHRYPGILPTLRMSTCPPLAVDRLVGLAGVSGNLVRSMEKGKLPPRMERATLDKELRKVSTIIKKMADPDIFVWLARGKPPTGREVYRAASVVADRLCGAVANPIIRNAQEQRQLKKIASWLRARGYREARGDERTGFPAMPSGTFGFHVNVSAKLEDASRRVNIPIDVVVAPKGAGTRRLPLLLEAKSAGDFTNVNKRRKEEATKVAQLRATYGRRVKFVLFLCGYFDTGYLGYEAGEGIDWVWEHRVNDLARFGL